LFALVLVSTGFGAISPSLHELQEEFQGGAQLGASLITAFSMGRLVTGLPAGLLLERIGTGRIILLGTSVFLVGSIVATFAPNLAVLWAGRLMQGMGVAAVPAGVLAQQMAVATEGRGGTAMATYQSAITAGSAFGPALGGPAASLLGWRGGLAVCIVAGVIACVLAWAGRRRHAEIVKRADLAAPISLVLVGMLLLVLLPNIVAGMYRFAYALVALPLFATTEIGFDTTTTGLLLGMQTAVALVLVGPGGRMCDRWGVRRVAAISGALVVVAVAATSLVADPLWLWIASAFYAVFLSILGVAAALFVFTLKGFSTGALVGMYRLSYDLVQVLGPLMVGALIDQSGFGTTFLALAAAGLLVHVGLIGTLRRASH
jgi:MFS family permease